MKLLAISVGFILILLLIWKLFYIPGIDADGTEIGENRTFTGLEIQV